MWPAVAGEAGLLELGDALGGDAVSVETGKGQAMALKSLLWRWGPGLTAPTKAHCSM